MPHPAFRWRARGTAPLRADGRHPPAGDDGHVRAAAAPDLQSRGHLPVLESYLEALRLQSGIPGMSAAVLRDGVIVWEKGFGFQNVATRLRATPDTPYLVGDMSGTLAAVLLLQCVEQRRLGLDEPFRRLAVDGIEPEATLRQILSHAAARVREGAVRLQPRALRAAHAGHGVVRAAAVPQERGAPHPQPARDEGLGAGHRSAGSEPSAARRACSIARTSSTTGRC